MATDFGPVPASQVKKESSRIFDALGEGRRVLISRYGKVIAAIDPVTHPLYEHVLAAYAMPGFADTHELTATDISQDGPAERIRAAEDGIPSLVTKNQKAYGMLQRFDGDGESMAAASDPDVREELLARFEQGHPDATPAEFAAEVERLAAAAPSAVAAPALGGAARVDLVHPTAVDGDELQAWVEGMEIRGYAYEQRGDFVAARQVFDLAIERVGDTTDDRIRPRIRTLMLKSARYHAMAGDAETALKLAEAVTTELDPASRRSFSGSKFAPAWRARLGHS